MKKLYFFPLIVLLAGCTHRNLIVNPGAELPPADSGWTAVSGRWMQRAKDPLPRAGKAYFFPGVAAEAVLYQDIHVGSQAFFIDLGLIAADYSGYVRSWPQRPADEAAVMLTCLDANGMALDSFKSNFYDTTNQWMHIGTKIKLPAGTRTIRVTLLSKRNNGSNNDGYHDDLSLTLSNRLPVYLIVIILVIALLFYAVRRRRNKRLQQRDPAA